MPELPEVETTRRGIEPWVVGRRVAAITIRNRQLRWPVDLPHDLVGQRVRSVGRRGKYLLLEIDTGHLIVHLGMSGSLRIVGSDEPLETHDHIDCRFTSESHTQHAEGSESSSEILLRYNDARRFGSWHFHEGDFATHWLLESLGVEPLGNEFSGQYLHRISRNRKVAIKNLIMDSKVVVGVGNIYAAEALFMAGIRPATAARRIPERTYDKLALTIRQVLADAVRQGGTTLRDFVGSDGQPGYFGQSLKVYGRADKPCLVCHTLLKGQVLGQRATVYCPNCQRSQGFQRV